MRAMLLVFMVGCSTRALPPSNVTVVRTNLNIPRVKGQVVEEESDNPYTDEDVVYLDRPRSTWITGEELERLKHFRETGCLMGDPICADGKLMTDTPP